MRKSLYFIAGFLLIGLTVTLIAYKTGLVTFTKEDTTVIAGYGYDPVAYYTKGRAIKGKEKFVTEFDGVLWRFESALHQKMFEEVPPRYVPAYGGNCALAVTNGDLAPANPKLWSILDNRLFLNCTIDGHIMFLQGYPQTAILADRNFEQAMKNIDEIRSIQKAHFSTQQEFQKIMEASKKEEETAEEVLSIPVPEPTKTEDKAAPESATEKQDEPAKEDAAPAAKEPPEKGK